MDKAKGDKACLKVFITHTPGGKVRVAVEVSAPELEHCNMTMIVKSEADWVKAKFFMDLLKSWFREQEAEIQIVEVQLRINGNG